MPPQKHPLDSLADKMTIGDGCWQWTATLDSRGYGQVRHNKRMTMAHRVVYELLVGSIPEGLDLDHLCRNRGCVRPDHLEPVDHRTNVLRGVSPSAVAARKTHCDHGHELASVGDRRRCRVCKNESERRRYYARKVA